MRTACTRSSVAGWKTASRSRESGRICKRRSSSRNHTYVSSAACRVCYAKRWSSDGRARVHDEDGKGVECRFYGVLLGVTHGVKHAYPQVWKRWFDKAKDDAQWKGNMVQIE